MESGLTFAGFLIFHCPLKPDAVAAVHMLNHSSHRVCNISIMKRVPLNVDQLCII